MAAYDVALFEGDILVADVPTTRSIAVANNTQLWSSGVIPYTLDPNLSTLSVRFISEAIDHWNEVGGISLLPIAEVQQLAPLTATDSVRFVAADHCASWVGRRGGQQEVWVAPYCTAGNMMHEIGHLLGLKHEHTRPDRDQYIQINWENIEPDERHIFVAAPAGSRLPGAYDYYSIMHYGSHNLSSNGQPTISVINGGPVRRTGQRASPSEGDLDAIAQLYGSDLSVTSRVAESVSRTELDIYVSNLSIQAAHDIHVDVGIDQGEFATQSVQEEWTCENSEKSRLLCKINRLQGNAVALLTIHLPDAQQLPAIDIVLTSKTPDHDLSNNISRVQADDMSDPPSVEPAPELAPASVQTPLVQEDAVGHVAVGGGAVSYYGLVALLMLLIRSIDFSPGRSFALGLFNIALP